MEEYDVLFPVVFKTDNNNWYIYDNSTRFVLPINDLDLEENDLDSTNTLINEQKIECIKKKYSKYSLFEDLNLDKEIDKWVNGSKDFIMKNGVRQLTLIITEACNFRCKYCFYSNEYNYSRSHSNKVMKWDIARKAIDYYFKINTEVLKHNPNFMPTIGFYGGEPLLNWEIILKVVEYIKINYSSKFKKLLYTITTNGYLLDEEKSKYLLENDFSIAISLDGNKEDHDRNRVLYNNKNTYDTVMKNIKKLENIYTYKANKGEEIYPYSLLMTYDNDTSFPKTINYALESPDIFSKFRKISKVKSMRTHYYDNQRSDKLVYKDILNIVESYIQGKSEDTMIEKILFNQLTLMTSNNVNLVNNVSGGTCIPGEKMAVTHQGKIYICERLDYQSPVGNIKDGIDWRLQKKYMSEFVELKKNHCKNCNISNLCNLCFANCSAGEDKFFIDKDYCKKYKSNIPNLFSLYYTALENGQILDT